MEEMWIRLLVPTTSVAPHRGPVSVGSSDVPRWLTLHGGCHIDDDPSPLAAPRRPTLNPDLYWTHVPGLPRLDFSVEAQSTSPLGMSIRTIWWLLAGSKVEGGYRQLKGSGQFLPGGSTQSDGSIKALCELADG